MDTNFFDVDVDGHRYAAKIYADAEAGQRSYETLRALFLSGFHKPSPFTVPAPVAYHPEYKLLIMEKAEGEPVSALLFREDAWHTAVADAAEWLAFLHSSPLLPKKAVAGPDRLQTELNDCMLQLSSTLPAAAPRIANITRKCLFALLDADPSRYVPCHGDYQPSNILKEDYKGVSVIAFDKFTRGERAMDVGYFLAHCAITGFLKTGTFSSTQRPRDLFLRDYVRAAGEFESRRLGIYRAIAFLQSLNHQLNTLRTGNMGIVEPWLNASEKSSSDGELDLLYAA